ncbi:MAG TPA: hypothetical protein V6D02_15965 [Candidatus Obscuribacterales bacterium]
MNLSILYYKYYMRYNLPTSILRRAPLQHIEDGQEARPGVDEG